MWKYIFGEVAFILQSPLSIRGEMSETRPEQLPACFPTESAYSQLESQSSHRLLLQFRYSSEVWKCLKQSQQFSDPLQYQTLQLCVIAAKPEWGQLLQALARLFPSLHPWCSGSFPSTYSELSLAFSPWLCCPYIYVTLSLLPYGFLWGKWKVWKEKRKRNEMKWKFRRFLFSSCCFNRSLSKELSTKTLGISPKYNK